MVSEETVRLRSEEFFAAGIKNTFNCETGSCSMRNSRGGFPEEHDVVRPVLLGRIKRGDIHRRARRSGGSVIHIPVKTVRVLYLSRRRVQVCFLPYQGLVVGAGVGGAFAKTGRVCGPRGIPGRGRGLVSGLPSLGGRGIRHVETYEVGP